VRLSLAALTCKQARERQRPFFWPEEVLSAQNGFKQTSVSQHHESKWRMRRKHLLLQPIQGEVKQRWLAKSSGCGIKIPIFGRGSNKND
jgi:hypothetical protein